MSDIALCAAPAGKLLIENRMHVARALPAETAANERAGKCASIDSNKIELRESTWR